MYYKDLGGKSGLANENYDYGLTDYHEDPKKRSGERKVYRSKKKRKAADAEDSERKKKKGPYLLGLVIGIIVAYAGLMKLKAEFAEAYADRSPPITSRSTN